ncbi:MAG TPA: DUF362 domain-containing protein [Dehalococcoidia bacterium]|nr:DUF362 domain-containing protein [Dehalococcoidia bacterium]
MSGKVALVHTDDRILGIHQAIDLLGKPELKDKRVVLKPNFNTADPFPASTHTDTLVTLISLIKELGARSIRLAERSGPCDSGEVMRRKNIFELGEKLGFEVINLDTLNKSDWVHMKPEGSHWSDGFKVPRLYREAESVVLTCCLKTHQYGGHFTMSLKNAVGIVQRSYMDELHASPQQRKMIAEINMAYKPDLILLDGIEAFVMGGPMEGKKVVTNVILAADDRIALDAAGVALLRLHKTTPEVSRGAVFEQEQIARAVELGLGTKSAEEIQFLTGDRQSQKLAARLREILLS